MNDGSTRVRHDLALPFDLTALARGRSFAADLLSEWPEERVDDVLLCVSELVTNAVLHGAADVALGLEVEPSRVVVAVTDRGAVFAADALDPGMDHLRGRGLHLVSLLASAWGVRQPAGGGSGKTVWCEVVA